QGRLSAGRNNGFHTTRLPPYMGDMALRRKPGSDCPDEARRLEVGTDGAALCPRQRLAVGALDQCGPRRMGHQICTKQVGDRPKVQSGEIDARTCLQPW